MIMTNIYSVPVKKLLQQEEKTLIFCSLIHSCLVSQYHCLLFEHMNVLLDDPMVVSHVEQTK